MKTLSQIHRLHLVVTVATSASIASKTSSSDKRFLDKNGVQLESYIHIRKGSFNPIDGTKMVEEDMRSQVDAKDWLKPNGDDGRHSKRLLEDLNEDDDRGASVIQVHNCSFDFSTNKWHIPSPETFYCDTSASFVLRFELSDWNLNDFVDYQMFAPDSNFEYTVDITNNTYMQPGVIYDSMPEQGDGTGCRQMAYFLDFDPNILMASPLYFEPTPENGLRNPYISFATRTLLYNSGPPWHPWYSLANWIDIDFYFKLMLSNVGFMDNDPFGSTRKLSAKNGQHDSTFSFGNQQKSEHEEGKDEEDHRSYAHDEDYDYCDFDEEIHLTGTSHISEQAVAGKAASNTGSPFLMSNETLMVMKPHYHHQQQQRQQATEEQGESLVVAAETEFPTSAPSSVSIEQSLPNCNEDHDGLESMLEPYENDHRRNRQLLRCYDGFGVVFDTRWEDITATQAPSFSLVPTQTPEPTSPTVSMSPTSTDAPTATPPTPAPRPTPGSLTVYRDAQEAYGVDGYLCDENNDPLPPLELPFGDRNKGTNVMVIVEVGDSVRVCVKRNAKSIRDNIFIRYIDAFAFFKWGNEALRQIAIRPTAVEAKNGLTEVFCEKGSDECYFTTYLMGGFFETSGVVTGSGKATMQFNDKTGVYGTRGRRRSLVQEGDVPGRSLDAETKPFEAAENINSQMKVAETAGSVSFEFAVLTHEDAKIARDFNIEKNKKEKSRLAVGLGIMAGCLLLCCTLPFVICLCGRRWKKKKMPGDKRPVLRLLVNVLKERYHVQFQTSSLLRWISGYVSQEESIDEHEKEKFSDSYRRSFSETTLDSAVDDAENESRKSRARSARRNIQRSLDDDIESRPPGSARSNKSRSNSPKTARRWLTIIGEVGDSPEEHFSDEETKSSSNYQKGSSRSVAREDSTRSARSRSRSQSSRLRNVNSVRSSRSRSRSSRLRNGNSVRRSRSRSRSSRLRNKESNKGGRSRSRSSRLRQKDSVSSSRSRSRSSRPRKEESVRGNRSCRSRSRSSKRSVRRSRSRSSKRSVRPHSRSSSKRRHARNDNEGPTLSTTSIKQSQRSYRDPTKYKEASTGWLVTEQESGSTEADIPPLSPRPKIKKQASIKKKKQIAST